MTPGLPLQTPRLSSPAGFRLSPAAPSSATASTLPARFASNSAVIPSMLAVWSAFAASSSLTISTWPWLEAAMSGVAISLVFAFTLHCDSMSNLAVASRLFLHARSNGVLPCDCEAGTRQAGQTSALVGEACVCFAVRGLGRAGAVHPCTLGVCQPR
jgi:hypothetical protein